MRQFYRRTMQAEEEREIVFEKPVRKLSITVSHDAVIRLHFTDGSMSNEYSVYSRTTQYLDFQTANNGGGVSEIYVKATTTVGGYMSVSIIEYGTGGNIDWYK